MKTEVVVRSSEMLVNDPLIENYKDKYGFNYIEDSKFKIRQNIGALEEIIEAEKYNARKKVFESKLSNQKILFHDYELCEVLQADLISLPIRYHPFIQVHERIVTHLWTVSDRNLFMGGIDHIVYYTKESIPTSYNVPISRSIYIGDLPGLVQRKYELAKRHLNKERICVVSRDSRLFSSETIVVVPPKISPLLIAQTETGKLLLLAVWGIEHELPKSLGGLLEDSK